MLVSGVGLLCKAERHGSEKRGVAQGCGMYALPHEVWKFVVLD